MFRISVAVFFLLILFSFQYTTTISAAGPERFEFAQICMGVPVRFVLYTNAPELAEQAASQAFECINRLNTILSDYDSDSELSRLCTRSTEHWKHSGHEGQALWLDVSDDFFHVLKAAREYGQLSDGAFDITVGPMTRLWRRSRRQGVLPKERYLEQARQLVGLDRWKLDENERRIQLLRPGMRLDLGGIAKGYAIDQAFETIRGYGIETLLVDAGGDLRIGTAPPGGWRIGLAETKRTTGDESTTALQNIVLENIALASSGDESRFVEIDGVRYSHLINPKTGLGLTQSMTVFVTAPTAMQADSLASAIAVLGPEKGIRLADSQKRIAAKIILHADPPEIFQSKNWRQINATSETRP